MKVKMWPIYLALLLVALILLVHWGWKPFS